MPTEEQRNVNYRIKTVNMEGNHWSDVRQQHTNNTGPLSSLSLSLPPSLFIYLSISLPLSLYISPLSLSLSLFFLSHLVRLWITYFTYILRVRKTIVIDNCPCVHVHFPSIVHVSGVGYANCCSLLTWHRTCNTRNRPLGTVALSLFYVATPSVRA